MRTERARELVEPRPQESGGQREPADVAATLAPRAPAGSPLLARGPDTQGPPARPGGLDACRGALWWEFEVDLADRTPHLPTRELAERAGCPLEEVRTARDDIAWRVAALVDALHAAAA